MMSSKKGQHTVCNCFHLLSNHSAELIESAMYLYRATKDPYFLEVGRDMLESIESSARTPCGYATVSTVFKYTVMHFHLGVDFHICCWRQLYCWGRAK